MIFDRESIDLPIPPPIEWFGLSEREYELYRQWEYGVEQDEIEEVPITQENSPRDGLAGIVDKIKDWLAGTPEPSNRRLGLTYATIRKSRSFEEACEEYQETLEEFIEEWREVTSRNRAEFAHSRANQQFWLSLNWREFEKEVAWLWSDLGWAASVSYPYADDGIDVIASREHEKILIQCKKWKKPIGPRTVEEVYGRMNDHRYLARNDRRDAIPRKALLIGTGGFTDSAVSIANEINKDTSQEIALLNMQDLIKLSQDAEIEIRVGSEPSYWSLDPSPKCPRCASFMIAHEENWRCSRLRCSGLRYRGVASQRK